MQIGIVQECPIVLHAIFILTATFRTSDVFLGMIGASSSSGLIKRSLAISHIPDSAITVNKTGVLFTFSLIHRIDRFSPDF